MKKIWDIQKQEEDQEAELDRESSLCKKMFQAVKKKRKGKDKKK
jgi:hypothetical protein